MRNQLITVAVLVVGGTARADVPRCSQVDADLSYMATDLPNVSGDTGWFPSWSVAQLRLTGKMEGQTTVAMSVTPTACWSNGMTISAPGIAQSGYLDSEYGAALALYGQIHTSVLGHAINWSRQIPIPFIPDDLLLAGTTTFDATALPGSAQPTVSVTSAPTDPVIVLSTDLLTAVIDIVGISGGLEATVQGVMTTKYSTTAIALGDGRIRAAGDSFAIAAPERGFGATLDLPILATGVVHYEPSLIFGARFDVKIFGLHVVTWQIASVTMPLPVIDRPITLTGQALHIPLPHLAALPTSLGFASGAMQRLRLHNSGAAPLVIAITSAPAGITASGVTIAPGADGELAVSAADPTTLSGELVLATNDPNHAQLTVALDAAADGETTVPADPSESSGCNAGHGQASMFGFLLALAIVCRRRLQV
ncbi:MAG: hypothetical protein JWO36_6711 [Myxococcales bacterium]|nr:hypothetical protein [Myxococcales bacterium]